jgi:hypothetical protein
LSTKRGLFETDAIKSAIPRDLGIDSNPEQRKMMDRLLESSLSPFYKRTMADIFLYSFAYAHKMGLDPLSLKKRSANIPVSSLGDEGLVLIFSTLLAHIGNFDLLTNEKEVRQIIVRAEELANAGLSRLYDIVFGDEAGHPDRKLERGLLEFLSKKAS